MFQEDPQLLDPVLAGILTPVLDLYSDLIRRTAKNGPDEASKRLLVAFSRVICAFCKVRGSKVISRFLSNEPRYLQPAFQALKRLDGAANERHDWEEHYAVLLWLSNLILTPFDLASYSSVLDSDIDISGLKLPANTPLFAVEAVRASLHSLDSATSRKAAAASLLVRLTLRPDMLKLGLQRILVPYAVQTLESCQGANDIHRAVGLMIFLNGIVASGATHDIHSSIPLIYQSITGMFNTDQPDAQPLQNSALAKKFSIKTQRNCLVQLLKARGSPKQNVSQMSQSLLDEQGALEEAVDYLLRSLADRDTQVRMAGSKALAFLALQLDQEMAQEIVEAVIGSLQEDVLPTDGGKSLEAVNPVFWHGLTLTLSHMLFRRTPSPAQIPEILEALYLALTFEQKSSSGGSIGGNVRDAANYGLWSLARRYSTAELLSIDTSAKSVIQETATSLVCAACLDPVGNVRRGSSAALQELIGRHPDTITNGIALVQTVDYLAVGLRSRAMITVSCEAAELGSEYRSALIEGLLSWRGVAILDQAARSYASVAVGQLICGLGRADVQAYLQRLTNAVRRVGRGSAEHVEGLLLAQAEVLKSSAQHQQSIEANYHDGVRDWLLFNNQVETLHTALKFAGRRAYLVANGVLALLNALSACFHEQSLALGTSGQQTESESSTLSTTGIALIVHALKTLDEKSKELDTLFAGLDKALPKTRRLDLANELLAVSVPRKQYDARPNI